VALSRYFPYIKRKTLKTSDNRRLEEKIPVKSSPAGIRLESAGLPAQLLSQLI